MLSGIGLLRSQSHQKRGEKMPTPGDNESRDKFIQRCIPVVIEDGTAEDQAQAVAVCNSMWNQKTVTEVLPFADEDAVVSIGGEVKALGEGRTAGWLVEFTDAASPDLENDYFDGATEYGPHTQSLAFYHHGADQAIGRKALTHPAAITIKDTGVWMEHQLELRDEYEAAIYNLVEKGKLGLSSGTAPHLVERERKGTANHITRWYLGLDASYTPTPANWQSRVMPLKSYVKSVGSISLLEADETIPQESPPIQDAEPKTAEAVGESMERRRRLGQAQALSLEVTAILEGE